MKYDAFISYRRDGGFLTAQVIHDHLKAKGIHCFLDLESLNSGTYDDKILNAIENSPNFILILSKGSLDRCVDEHDWVRKEIHKAVELKKTIIPIIQNGFTWPTVWDDGIPDFVRYLERVNSVIATTIYLEAMIDKIISYMTGITSSFFSITSATNVLNIATSNLTVVDSVLRGWDCDELFLKFGFKVERHPYKWTDAILNDLLNGNLDLAIYNKESCKSFNANNGNKIHTIRDVCSSMGGRNFYILASIYGKWSNMTLAQFKENIDNTTVIGVSKSSDMFKNLLYILDMTEQELTDRGVKIMNYSSDQGLGIFDIMPDMLIIAGQDIRFLAERTGNFREIISYDDFPPEKKQFFKDNSINSLLIGPSGMEKLNNVDLDDIGMELMLNFYRNIMSPQSRDLIKEKLSRQLKNICDAPDSIDYILKKIMFETYRIL